MSEVTQEEYQSYQNKKWSATAEKTKHENAINGLNDDIAQLERVKERVKVISNDFEKEVSTLKSTIGEKREFTGKNKTTLIDSYGASLTKEAQGYRDKEVKRVLSDIEVLLAKKKTKLSEEKTSLSQAKRKLEEAIAWLSGGGHSF